MSEEIKGYIHGMFDARYHEEYNKVFHDAGFIESKCLISPQVQIDGDCISIAIDLENTRTDSVTKTTHVYGHFTSNVVTKNIKSVPEHVKRMLEAITPDIRRSFPPVK